MFPGFDFVPEVAHLKVPNINTGLIERALFLSHDFKIMSLLVISYVFYAFLIVMTTMLSTP